MSRFPPIKFDPPAAVRVRLERIAEFHGIGHNAPSANEVAKLIASQFSLVKPAQFFQALAALKPFQVTNPFAGLGPIPAPKSRHRPF
ncbi:MAG: hypothetical protein C0502_05090 [Opitutus sp.]|nr:hypothetical protein [Opitutus sp.]